MAGDADALAVPDDEDDFAAVLAANASSASSSNAAPTVFAAAAHRDGADDDAQPDIFTRMRKAFVDEGLSWAEVADAVGADEWTASSM